MSATAENEFGPEVLLIFLGHSADADELADTIYGLQSDLQRILSSFISVASNLPFKTVKIWEWRRDAVGNVGGQEKVVSKPLGRANISVFVFKERIGKVSWEELDKSRSRREPEIPVLAFFPLDSPPNLNAPQAVREWLGLLEKKAELVQDWTSRDSRALVPTEDYKDEGHLKHLVLDQIQRAIRSILQTAKIDFPILPDATECFLSKQDHLSHDAQAVRARTLNDLDPESLRLFLERPLSRDFVSHLREGGGDTRVSESEQLEQLGCLNRGKPTFAALLCFGKPSKLAEHKGCNTLHMTVHDGVERGGKRAPITPARGNLLQLFHRGMDWLTTSAGLRRRGVIGDASRDELEIPEIVFREALGNALIHRDYESEKLREQPTRIDVFSDRVEITSYGLLMDGVSVDLLNNPAQAHDLRPFRRNPVVAEIFQCMALVELNASGVPRMRREMTRDGLPIPRFKMSEQFVTVILARPFDPRSPDEAVLSSPRPVAPGGSAFISSTLSDLPEHREAVQNACLIAGVFPVAVEQQPTGRDSSSAVEEALAISDVFVCILGWRYGQIDLESGKSLLELEYNKAKALNIPILAFAMDKDHPLTLAQIDSDAGSRALLNEFKDRIRETSVLVEFSSPGDLRTKVAAGLVELKESKKLGKKLTPAKSTTTLKTSIPNNLPRLQPFFGREEELKIIREALDPESRTWGALIDGPGGMGKTSLAVRAAYDAPPEDFGRIIFISLKTRELDDDGVRDLSGFILTGLQELYNELARELGHAEIATAPESERPQLLLDSLRGARTLLVLDNLESLTRGERGSILTFVKRLPSGCKAVLTSRGRIGSGAEELILEKLGQDAALQTLAELATHNPALAKTSEAERIALYTQTGGKPLLLRWAAGQIGRGHCLTFTDAIEFLRSCPPGNDPLEFIFGDLADDFTEDEAKVLAVLSYFSLPAKVKYVADLANVEEDVCLRALKSLVNRSLAVPTEELEAFALVPMLADFLRHHRPGIVRETGDRLRNRAYAIVLESGYHAYGRFPSLDAEWDSVSPALPLLLAGPNETLQTTCDAIGPFLNFTGRWDEWLVLSQKAEAKALMSGDDSKAGWRAYQAGYVHYRRGQAEEVLACAERASAHWGRAGAGSREHAAATRLRGLGHQLKEDYPTAIAAYRETLELYRSIGAESKEVAIALNDLADAKRASGDLDAAERHFREALHMARTSGDAEGEGLYTGNLAALALDREDWQTGEPLARRALSLSEEIGRLELIAENSFRLAMSLLHQGKPVESLPYARRAVEIFTKLGSPDLKTAQATLRECEQAVD